MLMIPEGVSTCDITWAVFGVAGAATTAVAIKGETAKATRASFFALLMPDTPYRLCFGFFSISCRLGRACGVSSVEILQAPRFFRFSCSQGVLIFECAGVG